MTQSITCDICARRYPTHECQQGLFTEEEVNAIGNFNKGNYQEGIILMQWGKDILDSRGAN